MPLHIDEIQTEVQAEAAEGGAGAPEADAWQQLARWRQLQGQMLDDRERTCAHGNED